MFQWFKDLFKSQDEKLEFEVIAEKLPDNTFLINNKYQELFSQYAKMYQERWIIDITEPQGLNFHILNQALSKSSIEADVAHIRPCNWLSLMMNMAAIRHYDSSHFGSTSYNAPTVLSIHGMLELDPSAAVGKNEIQFENTKTNQTHVEQIVLPKGNIKLSYKPGFKVNNSTELYEKFFKVVSDHPGYEIKFDDSVPDNVKKRINNLLIFS